MKTFIQLCALAATTTALLTSCPQSLTAPTVTISAPAEAVYTNGSVAVQLTVTGDPTAVELLKDGTTLATLTAPYSYTWNTATEPEKSYALTAKVTRGSEVVTSAERTIVVDRTAPTVSAFTPASNAQNVYLSDEISLTFDEAVQPSSITATNVTLAQGIVPIQLLIPSTKTLNTARTKLTIKPTVRPTSLGVPITVSIADVKDLAGNALLTTTSTFTAPEWQAPGGIAPLDLNVALTAGTSAQSLAVDGSGNQVVAWSESNGTSTNIYVKRWNGSSWAQVGTTFLNVNTNKDATEPALKLDSSGNPVVAWKELDGNTNRIYAKRWNGSAWVQIGSNALSGSLNAETPSLALDASGDPVVTWRTVSASPLFSNIQVARWDGSTWINIGGKLDVNDSGNTDFLSFNPSVALTSSGNPVVAWSETDGTSRNIYVKRWDGSTWAQVGGKLDANTDKNAFRPSLALDGSGNPVVAWNEAATNSAGSVYVKRWNGSVWAQVGFDALDVNTNGTIGAGGLSLALDGNGNPTVAWADFDGMSYNAHVKRWNNGVWEIVGAVNLDTNLDQDVYGISLAQDASGNPSVAWNEDDSISYNVLVKRLNRIP